MYKAIIFDLDDTLYDYETINRIATEKLSAFTCKKFGVTEAEFNEAFLWAKKQTKSLLGETAASHNRMLYCQKTLERLGKNPVDGALGMYDCYWDCMLDTMQLRDGTLALLAKLKADKVKIALCTDLTAHIQHRKIQRLGLTAYIDVLVTSEEASVEKPNKKIYELVLQKLNLAPADCLFVGDSQKKDEAGPRTVGMHSIRFTNMNDLEKYIYG